MNQVPEEKKDSMTKTLAILGFAAIIILIVWLAVKVVALIPSAFSSLASIADSVYNASGNKELVVSTKNSVVNADEPFTVSWDKLRGDGSYGFSYKCADGVSLTINKNDTETETIDCGEFIDLGDSTDVTIAVTAEKQRFTDVEYTITYMREGAENISTESVITIINASIPTGAVAGTNTDTPAPVEPVVAEPARPTVTTPTTPTTPTQTAGTPTVVKKYIYEIPESDPNGKVDLQVTHLGVGTVKGGVFTPLTKLDTDQSGAIRFEIKNVGTKTSSSWSYEANLPSDITYKSDDQKALKPNERVVIPLGFDGITRTGTESFGVDVTATGDVNKANNDYTWSVQVVK